MAHSRGSRAGLCLSRAVAVATATIFRRAHSCSPLARARLAADGGVPVYAGSSGSGFGRSFRGALEYQVTPHLALGAQLELDRSAYYAPTNFMVYGRYRFEPGNAPLDNRPRPVQTLSLIHI